jgi:hypothetical protein
MNERRQTDRQTDKERERERERENSHTDTQGFRVMAGCG